ncbi:MAG: DUF1844 domain-containing protein [Phycisphaerales bacterium]|nr:DUF1844 domain-containing protein [Phycisphaerales bacterium]
MADEAGETPKIIVDSDWKSQAQAEKQKLQEQEAARQEASGDVGPGGMPPADFRAVVGMFASQALMYMGGVADKSGRAVFDPYYAQYMIDMLAVLEEKTKGNITKEEADDLASVLHELRSRFVELMQMAMQQQAQGGAGGATPPPPPGATT